MIDIQALSQALADRQPNDLSDALKQYAAVAVIIRCLPGDSTQIGYIKRSDRPGDKWSGHVAFPGGKREPGDLSSVATAIRETFEEVGIALTSHDIIGRLSDIQARNQNGMLPFYIRPHVFVLDEEPLIKLDFNEVAAFEWIEVSWLLNPSNQKIHSITGPDGTRELPAYNMPDKSTLWGLTYMITVDLLECLKSYGMLK